MARPMTPKTSVKNGQYMLYSEDQKLQDPIPFITARRFWLLLYMLLGVTGISMFVARFLMRPLVLKVLRSRQDYQNHVHGQLSAFITNLAKSITALPGRSITVDTTRHRLYVNTETQTDENEPSTNESAVVEPVSQVSLLNGLPSKMAGFQQDTEETQYNELSQKLAALKSYLYDFDSYTYKASYGGFSGSGTGSSVPGGEGIQKVKAEIRSVKGSLLNARTFHSIQPRTT